MPIPDREDTTVREFCFRYVGAVVLTILLGMMLVPQTGFASPEIPEKTTIIFNLKTYDGLELPARVVFPKDAPKKLVIFI